MADFVTRNRPDWDELEQLLARGRRSVGRLSPEELNRLDVLYRRVAVHLAQVRTRTRDERQIGRRISFRARHPAGVLLRKLSQSPTLIFTWSSATLAFLLGGR